MARIRNHFWSSENGRLRRARDVEIGARRHRNADGATLRDQALLRGRLF